MFFLELGAELGLLNKLFNKLYSLLNSFNNCNQLIEICLLNTYTKYRRNQEIYFSEIVMVAFTEL